MLRVIFLCFIVSSYGYIIYIPDEYSVDFVHIISDNNKCTVINSNNTAAKTDLAYQIWNKAMTDSEHRWYIKRNKADKCKLMVHRYGYCTTWRYYFDFFDFCKDNRHKFSKCQALIDEYYPKDRAITGYPGYQLPQFPIKNHLLICK